jgi:hypothetical protein
MESESDVECIQSPTLAGQFVGGERRRRLRATLDRFPFHSCLDHALFHNLGVFVINFKPPHHKTRPLEATTRLVPSTYNAAQPLHHLLGIHPFDC